MGYNRSGVRRTARLKRRKREEIRLAKKAEQQGKSNAEPGAGKTPETGSVRLPQKS